MEIFVSVLNQSLYYFIPGSDFDPILLCLHFSSNEIDWLHTSLNLWINRAMITFYCFCRFQKNLSFKLVQQDHRFVFLHHSSNRSVSPSTHRKTMFPITNLSFPSPIKKMTHILQFRWYIKTKFLYAAHLLSVGFVWMHVLRVNDVYVCIYIIVSHTWPKMTILNALKDY